MSKLDLEEIESQLKKRLEYPYLWMRKQNDSWDNATRFIYKYPNWDDFVKAMEKAWKKGSFDKNSFSHYAMNRWYNFWSAQAAEQIFTELPGVAPNPNPKEDQYDFRWLGERFDLKTSVFPKGYDKEYALTLCSPDGRESRALDFAKAHPEHLIQWFYKNQSTQQRFHLKNRLFIVCYDEQGAHYKLKSEITLLKQAIENYMKERTPADTFSLYLEEGKETLADIIWVEK